MMDDEIAARVAKVRADVASWEPSAIRRLYFEAVRRCFIEELPDSAIRTLAGAIRVGEDVGIEQRDAELIVFGGLVEAIDARVQPRAEA